MKVLHSLTLVLFAITAFGILLPAEAAPDKAALRHTLRKHGVSTKPRGLGSFLARGWRGAEPPETLPEEPREKSALLYQAWVLLTLEYEELEDLPKLKKELGPLALSYAKGELPGGVRLIVAEDVRNLAPTMRERGQKLIEELLQYNGMVAFGFFGEINDENRKAAREIYKQTDSEAVRVTYAQTLAMLGDKSVIEDLVRIAAQGNRNTSIMAVRTLELLTGKVFELNANQAVKPRREAAGKIMDWWNDQDDSVPILSREDIIYRQLHPPPARRPSLLTLRDLLRASADKTDMTDARGSRTAWKKLDDRGKALAEDLEPILENEDEDLDIRAEALRWYVRIEGVKGARKYLKKLSKDPNPEIAELAEKMLEAEK